jgi:GT2 family glycosyltransferase
MNHPTFCFRKSKILEVGNYNKNIRDMYEDFELELRVLKKYGVIHNLPQVILYYRDSHNQITKGLSNNPHYWRAKRNELINSIINVSS